MSLVARLAGARPPPIHHASKRTYSILSKSGSGRFLASAKPPKALGKKSTPGSSTSSAVAVATSPSESIMEVNSTSATSGEETANELDASSDSRTDSHSTLTQSAATVSGSNADKESDKKQDLQSSKSTTAASSSSSPFSSLAFLTPEDMAIPHPRPTKEVLSLHSFFSLHRPLLLLPAHASQPLFNTSLTSNTPFGQMISSVKSGSSKSEESSSHTTKTSSSEPEFEVELGSGKPLPSQNGNGSQVEFDEIDTPEADADAARLLGRTFVVNRLGSFVDWQDVLKTLGDGHAKTQIDAINVVAEETIADQEVVMDSVKRKKKRKMNKHIYKKRRKKERAQRRRLGK